MIMINKLESIAGADALVEVSKLLLAIAFIHNFDFGVLLLHALFLFYT